MNKRDLMLDFVGGSAPVGYTPAAFFLHFDPAYHQGQAAIDKHLEFFRFTGMDFVKVQYEQILPAANVARPDDWLRLTVVPEDIFEPTVHVVRGLAQSVRGEALVVLTVYSPLMWAARACGKADLRTHIDENPQAFRQGLEIMTENVIRLVKACQRVGADGFYVSTQGGESNRFAGTDYFEKYIKPTDLAVWDAVKDCAFNILHICDYEGAYDDISPFLDYPGHIVNSSLKVGDRNLTSGEIAGMFNRPFMGGMERKGVISTGSREQVSREVDKLLSQAPEHFILGADCTVLPGTPWENLQAAVEQAHKRE